VSPDCFFSRIIFHQALENNIRVISNFFKNSGIYSQVKVHHQYQQHWWQICYWCQRHQQQICRQFQLPVANLPLVNNTSDKFAASVNDTGGKLPPVSTTLAVNLHFTLSPVNKHSRKPRPKEVKRAANKLWKTKFPLASIR
jgi:hypothetical protein